MHRMAIAACVVLALSQPSSPVFGQSGSTGGSVGKHEKSVSGSEAKKPTRPQGGRALRRGDGAQHGRRGEARAPAPRNATSRSLSGRWSWVAQCPIVGELQGFITLAQRAASFTGVFGGTNMWDQGTIPDGRVNGHHLTFTRHTPSGGIQHWTATTDVASDGALHMRGSTQTSVGTCTVDATKL
jgi:hypothetical protein